MLKFYDEIIFEYQKNKDYDLMIATGLRQIPYDRIKYYYRLKNHNEFLKKISVKFKDVIPKMSRDFIVFFDDQESTNKAEKIFNQINELNKMQIFYTDKRNNSIFVTLTINDQISDKYEIMVNKDNRINIGSNTTIAFGDMQSQTVKGKTTYTIVMTVTNGGVSKTITHTLT